MVSKWCTHRARRFSPGNRHQSKIYSESSSLDFLQIFIELSSKQTLAIYPRLLLVRPVCVIDRNGNQKRPPGSQDVFSAAFDVLARAGAGATAQGQNA
jgi:accessory colonization factor AcfC